MSIVSHGDGSSGVRFFTSKEGAERFMMECDERFCDDICDVSRGVLVDEPHYEWQDFARSVSRFIGARGTLPLAEHFECGEGEVRQWADAIHVPKRTRRRLILEFIERIEERK